MKTGEEKVKKADLKPCPFCGHPPELEEVGGIFNLVHTSDCIALGVTTYFEAEEAIRKWNRRWKGNEPKKPFFDGEKLCLKSS